MHPGRPTLSDLSASAEAIAYTVEAAKVLLAQRFGGAQELLQPQDLGGNGSALVLRCKITPNPFLQERTVIVKRMPVGEEGVRSADTLSFIREVVAYQYTNTLPELERPGPLLLAYDIKQRILILSDVGDGQNFVDVLNLESADQRKGSVRKLGRALGHMHAATYGDEQAYITLLNRQAQKHGVSADTITDSDIDIANLIYQGVNLMKDNGVPLDPVVESYAEEAAQRQRRKDLRAFTPFDLAPDNILLTQRIVFLDYEWASFRDIAIDVACVIAGFPQDNTTPALTKEDIREFMSSWRAEVAHVWPHARDDRSVAHALMTALIGWSFMSLTMIFHASLATDNTDSATSLSLLTNSQLEDLATTLDAVRRFAHVYAHVEDNDFSAVTAYAEMLLRVLAKLGAYPQSAKI